MHLSQAPLRHTGAVSGQLALTHARRSGSGTKVRSAPARSPIGIVATQTPVDVPSNKQIGNSGFLQSSFVEQPTPAGTIFSHELPTSSATARPTNPVAATKTRPLV